jgi:hypothetical protein
MRRSFAGYVGSSESQGVRTFLLSRSLDSEEVRAFFTDVFGAPYSPVKATGRPDASVTALDLTWTPSMTNASAEWLELDYEPARPAHQVILYEPRPSSSVSEVLLFDTNGVQLCSVHMAGNPSIHIRGGTTEVNFPLTDRPVGRLRFIVENRGPAALLPAIDAVELVGPAQRSWAVRARASSYAVSGPGALGMSPAMARRYGLSTGRGARLSVTSQNLVRSELEMSQWSDHWLAYSPYDAVLMTARDYAAATESSRAALLRYVECGGALITLGRIEIPDPWRTRVRSRDHGVERVQAGFGHYLGFDVTDLRQMGREQGQWMLDTARISGWPWAMPSPPNTAAAHELFPVIANVKIPFRSMVLILLVFVVLIGPINLVLLSRYRRKIWALWTIPLVSLVTCGLVFAYSFLSEGITALGRLEGLTLLDQVNHRASTLGMMAFYCPLTPAEGLRFGYDTEVTPVLDLDYRRLGRPREVDWTRSQHFHTGWLVSRVPAYFRLRKSEVRRERIQFEKDPGGQWAVVNGLGAPIQSLNITDFAGRTYEATDVAAGQRVVLAPRSMPGIAPASTNLFSDLYRGSSWAPMVPLWEKLQTNALPNGTYLARLSGTPFLEEPMTGSAFVQRHSLVLGILNPGELPP